jgi:hypothetical protein
MKDAVLANELVRLSLPSIECFNGRVKVVLAAEGLVAGPSTRASSMYTGEIWISPAVSVVEDLEEENTERLEEVTYDEMDERGRD